MVLASQQCRMHFALWVMPLSKWSTVRRVAPPACLPLSLCNAAGSRQLREVLLCALPKDVLEKGTLNQVSRQGSSSSQSNSPKEAPVQQLPLIPDMA